MQGDKLITPEQLHWQILTSNKLSTDLFKPMSFDSNQAFEPRELNVECLVNFFNNLDSSTEKDLENLFVEKKD